MNAGELKTRPAYDAWLMWNTGLACNFHCHYCINDSNIRVPEPTDPASWKRMQQGGVQPIVIDALLATLARTGKTFRLTLTGGEPFIIPNIMEACTALTKNHFIALNTNLVAESVKLFAESAIPADRIHYVVASFHPLELERVNKVALFIENYKLLERKGIRAWVMGVGHPGMKEKIAYYKKYLGDHGISINIEPFRGYYQGKQYPDAYTEEERAAIGMDTHMDNSFYRHENKQCNAGYNIAFVDPQGDVFPCATLINPSEKIGNIYTGIHFTETLKDCPVAFCGCPFKLYDKDLFAWAEQEVRAKYHKEVAL